MHGAKLFIVEDERIVSMALQRIAQKLGYTVAGTATSGEAALEGVGAAAPDLVLMDIELDGVAMAERLRAAQDAPVDFLTGYSDAAMLERAQVAHPAAYILKPVEPANCTSPSRPSCASSRRWRASAGSPPGWHTTSTIYSPSFRAVPTPCPPDRTTPARARASAMLSSTPHGSPASF